MPFIEYIYFVVLGLLSGFLAGMLGIGGGIIIVPCLLLILHFMGFSYDHIMQHVVATSLACITFTSIVATWHHHKKNGVVWPLSRSILPGVIIGAVLGAYIAHLISSNLLEVVFGVFLIILAIYLFVRKDPEPPVKRQVHRGSIQSLMGLVISFVASNLGIGGGTFYVPLFLGYKMPMKNAVATSACCTFFNALVGTIIYVILGWEVSYAPSFFGYVYLPAFFAISVGIVFSTSLGVRLAHRLPGKFLKKTFACILVIIGLLMVIR